MHCHVTGSLFLCYLLYHQMGVHELGLRRNILREVEHYNVLQEEEKAAAKLKELEGGKVCEAFITWVVLHCNSRLKRKYHSLDLPQKLQHAGFEGA